MKMPKLIVLAAAMTFSVVALMAPTPADACSPGPSFLIEVLDDDTPECVELEILEYSFGAPVSIPVDNQCDDVFELEAVECPDCEQQVMVAPEDGNWSEEEYNEFELSANPAEVVIEQRNTTDVELEQAYLVEYEWTSGEESGTVQVELFRQEVGGCSTYPGCSTAGASLPADLAVLAVLLSAAVGLRRWYRPSTETA